MSLKNHNALLILPLLALLSTSPAQLNTTHASRSIASEVSTVVNPNPHLTAEIKKIDKKSLLDSELDYAAVSKNMDDFAKNIKGVREDFKEDFKSKEELKAFKEYLSTEVKNFLQNEKDINKVVDSGKISDEQSLEIQTKVSETADFLEKFLGDLEKQEKPEVVAVKVEEKKEEPKKEIEVKKEEKKTASRVKEEEHVCPAADSVLTTQIASLIKQQESMMDMMTKMMQMMMFQMQSQQMNQYQQLPQNMNNPYANSQQGAWTFIPNGYSANLSPMGQQPSQNFAAPMQTPGINMQSTGQWGLQPQMSFQQNPAFAPNQTFSPGNFGMAQSAPASHSFNLDQSAGQFGLI